MFYKVDDELYDLVPAAQHLSESILSKLKEMAGLVPKRHSFWGVRRRLATKPEPPTASPKQGRIQLSCGQATIDMVAEVYTYDFGERIHLTFSPCSAVTSERAQRVLSLLMDRHHRNRRFGEQPPESS